jgi:hypothetical protein
MSFTVDDLVSSLSSNHIGQEALDLAALQAQLAQTLFSQPLASNDSSFHQPCNTPTGRTPSSSFSWGQVMDVQQRLGSRRNADEMMMVDDAEDERMVEEILIPSSSSPPASAVSPHPSSSSSPFAQLNMNGPSQRSQSRTRFTSPSSASASSVPTSPSMSMSMSSVSSDSSSSSSFASTDPFYLAQLQAMQAPSPTPPSVFSQLGRPAQHSPFVQHQQQSSRRESLGVSVSSFAPSLETHTHNMFVTAPVSF